MRYRPYRSRDRSTVEYPLLSADWVKRRCTTSDPELAAAHLLGFLAYDDAIKSILRTRPPEIETALDDKYFILLLINLFEQWFTHSNPRTALACLVPDFQESTLLWTNDGKLPSGVAGLYDPVDSSSKLDQQDYSSKLVLQRWLGGYVETLLKHPLLKSALF